MKIAMITDIEGVSGSNWGGFGMPQSGELPYYTRIMTAEINTVVRTLLDEGADKICVYEAHTFEPGVLPDDTRIEIGRDYRAFEDSDALFVVGQHGPAGDPKSVLAHTMNSVCNYKVTLNGMNCGELTYCAAVAGAMGIPTVFVSGDKQTDLEGRENLPEAYEFVCDCQGIGNHVSICRSYKAIEPELREKTKIALGHIGKTRPFDLGKITLEVRLRYDGMSEKARKLPFVKWQDNAMVIEAEDMVHADWCRKQVILSRDFWPLKYSYKY